MVADRWTAAELCVKFQDLTEAISDDPYNFLAWRNRAQFFASADYHDLAVGDFYKALLLLDNSLDASDEYHDQALRAFLTFSNASESELEHEEVSDTTADAIKDQSLLCYIGLTSCLLALGCIYDADQFCTRGLGLQKSTATLQELKKRIDASAAATATTKRSLARREIYPWNNHEPERYSETSINSLNDRIRDIAPKCTVQIVSLPLLTSTEGAANGDADEVEVKQLGLFASKDIAPGEDVLSEKSLLAVNNRLHDELCDACSAELSADPSESFACEECQTTIFCSEDCLRQAMASYHPAVCDNEDFEAINKDIDIKEATDALYGLLLGRAIAMAETQEIHPLELVETRFLWGDYSPWSSPVKDPGKIEDTKGPERPRTLPWSFDYDVAGPIHLLTTLDIDIFSSTDKFDFWILNTLFAKFRGVANARMNPRSGKPEVAAVHPLWCLANHSCSPNVTWEWGGKIRMWARDGSKGEIVHWGSDAGVEDKWRGGIPAGQEILNHYCDVQLPVKERREWAAGALGGICMCERCQWESRQA